MPTRPPQSEGVGHSPPCTPCYNSLNQVTEHPQGKQAESFKYVSRPLASFLFSVEMSQECVCMGISFW